MAWQIYSVIYEFMDETKKLFCYGANNVPIIDCRTDISIIKRLQCIDNCKLYTVNSYVSVAATIFNVIG